MTPLDVFGYLVAIGLGLSFIIHVMGLSFRDPPITKYTDKKIRTCPQCKFDFLDQNGTARSSMVEQGTHNSLVAGSNPSEPNVVRLLAEHGTKLR